ncbi:MAG: hypothetical protein KA354_17010 [Phycisphaerae bacterium]|nr:hypothetical protein [Phycisphaerae bacterium]
MRISILIAVAALGFLSSAAPAGPSTDLDSYVLFATGEGLADNTAPLTFKGGNAAGRGYVLGGNVGVNRADGNLGNGTQMINVGANGRFVMSEGTLLVGDSIQLGPEALVYDVYTNQQAGSGWSNPNPGYGVQGTVSVFTSPLFNPMPSLFDPFTTTSTLDVTVAKNTTYNGGTPLDPGEYRDLQVMDGASIYLTEGTYTFRRLNTGQSFNLFTVPGTVIQITGDSDPNSLDLQFNGNGSFVGSADSNVESVALFRYLGTDVNFSDSSTFWGVILAPNADIGLGRGMTHYGRFVSRQIHSDFNDNIYYRQFTPGVVVPAPGAVILAALGIGLVGWVKRHAAG